MTITERLARFTTYLDGSGHLSAEVGGKAAGLDWLLAHNYPVPEAAVITTVAYEAAAADESISTLVRQLEKSPLPTPDRIKEESATVERCFLEASVPQPVASAIRRVGHELLESGPVAVRSSATAEDLSDASFAGQYLTVTNVTELDELERAIRRCWASLWMPAARAYRKRHRLAAGNLAMAVVVQRMVTPAWSGVAFTIDPRGRRHLLRIEAVPGLGEDLVSGRVTPADYLVRRDTLEIVAASGPARLDFLEDLGRLALGVEQAAHSPQDIEWAYDDSGLTLLQARPITAPAPSNLNDGFDTVSPNESTFTPHGVIEMLPGVVSPLLWTINAPMLENAFRATFADLGAETPGQGRSIINRFRGRAALDLSAICDIARSLPGGTPDEVERQYLGRAISEPTREPSRRGMHLLAAMQVRRAHNRIADEVELIATASSALAGMQLDLTELPVRMLVGYRQRIRDLAWRGYAAEVGASSAAGATYRALELLLERWLTESEAASWAQALTRGALDRSAVGTAHAAALEDVLDQHSSDDIAEILKLRGSDARSQVAALGPGGEAFLRTLDSAVVCSMGSKAVYGGPTWIEDDSWIWRQLGLIVRGEIHRLPTGSVGTNEFAKLSRQLSADRRWRRTRILTGQFVDLRLRWLHRQVDETVRFLSLREKAKSALLVLGGEERRILLEAEDRLVASRRLPSSGLLDYLTDTELEGMLFGSCGLAEAEVNRRRKVALECSRAGPLPDWFSGHPDMADLPNTVAADRLEGWAASSGRITGPVRIVSSLADGARLTRGDVMVAHATDPSWTPLFLIAGGIVLETGGPLSHAAIVAREFGLPAVLNVPSATRELSEGETVLVDGTLGLVERIRQGAMA